MSLIEKMKIPSGGRSFTIFTELLIDIKSEEKNPSRYSFVECRQIKIICQII